MTSSTRDTASSKRKLLDAAKGLMMSHGFESTGIQAILDAAGVTKSNFYYHFKSKEELCLAALEEISNQFFKECLLPTFGNRTISARARLESFAAIMLANMEKECCNKGCPFVNLSAELSDFMPSFRARIDRFYERYLEVLRAWYQDGVTSGEFRDDLAAETAAGIVLTTINGTILMCKLKKSTEPINQNIDALMTMMRKN